MRALVVANPRLPPSIIDEFGYPEITESEQEASMVADMLQTEPLLRVQASPMFLQFHS